MLEKTKTLTSAKELADNCKVRFSNESAEYRRARTALLAEEIDLRRQIERVPDRRRQPAGAQLHARELGPVDDGHTRPAAREKTRAGAARRTAADDDDVVNHLPRGNLARPSPSNQSHVTHPSSAGVRIQVAP